MVFSIIYLRRLGIELMVNTFAPVLFLGLAVACHGQADELALPLPEGPIQTLVCQWDSAQRLVYLEPSRPTIEAVHLSNAAYYPPFSMKTNGRDLFDIQLPRWLTTPDWTFVMEQYSCNPRRLSVTCTKGPVTLTLDRKTLRGVEVNTYELGFVEEPSSVRVSHFSCAFQP